jgi:hypothetical protein
MGGVVHLGNLKNLTSLNLNMSVWPDKDANVPRKQIPQKELEKRVWALIRGEEASDAEAKRNAAAAAALRTEAQKLMRQAAKLIEQANALMDKATSLTK